MIIKTFEIIKKKFDTHNFFLIYGENEGQKNEIIQALKNKLRGDIENYDETQILNNTEEFYAKIFNKSFFATNIICGLYIELLDTYLSKSYLSSSSITLIALSKFPYPWCRSK